MKDEPNVVGKQLPYLSPAWQAYHFWMILDPEWEWEKKEFKGSDAVAVDYEAAESPIVEDREVKFWTKLQPVNGNRGQSRHYPASDQNLPPSAIERLVLGGWGHEHCDLCRTHIDAGEFRYCDPGERWMSEKWYERYVVQRDLAFVDEL